MLLTIMFGMEYLKNVTKRFLGNLLLVINDLKIKLINKDPVENTGVMDNVASYQLSSIYFLRALLSFLKDLRTRRKFLMLEF